MAVRRQVDPRRPAVPIIQPGKNCWRVERARSILLRAGRGRLFPAGQGRAAPRPQHGVHPRLGHLRGRGFAPGQVRPARRSERTGPAEAEGETQPTRLDELLAFIARRHPHLHCYILIWDYAALYTLERDPWSRWRLGWRTHRRVHFGFDDRHPVGGSHHQKVIVVDDQLAFCGGIDLTSHRWDTSAHRARRAGPNDDDGQAVRAVSRDSGHGVGTRRGEPGRAGPRPLARAGRRADAARSARPPTTLAARGDARPHRRGRRDRQNRARLRRAAARSANAKHCFSIRSRRPNGRSTSKASTSPTRRSPPRWPHA